MLRVEYGKIIVTCDNCEEELGLFDSFEDALSAVSEAEWKTTKTEDDVFEHFCLTCQE